MSTDTAAVLGQLGIQVVSIGTEIACKCPFHKDNHPSFSMNAKSGLWICYQCGASGTVEYLIQLVGGSDLNPEAIVREIKHKKLTEKPRPAKPHDLPPDPLIIRARFEGYRWPPTWARYQRRIRLGVVRAYEIRWDHGWIIPIWDPTATSLVGWQYKRLDYVSNFPKAVKKSQTLFGLRELEGETAVLVESPLDVCRLATVGIPALATYGAFVSRAQQRMIVDRVDHLVMALDNDEEGQRQTQKLYRYFAKSIRTRVAQYPDGVKDPGDMSDKQLQRTFGDLQRNASTISKEGVRSDARSGVLSPSA